MAYVLSSGQRLCHAGRMSKGHGRVERAILEALSMKRGKRRMWHLGTDAATLAHYVAAGKEMYSAGDPYRKLFFDSDGHPQHAHYTPTRSELESVRRALRKLRKQGLVSPPTRYPSRVYYECRARSQPLADEQLPPAPTLRVLPERPN
jgi:hypothetical protein